MITIEEILTANRTTPTLGNENNAPMRTSATGATISVKMAPMRALIGTRRFSPITKHHQFILPATNTTAGDTELDPQGQTTLVFESLNDANEAAKAAHCYIRKICV